MTSFVKSVREDIAAVFASDPAARSYFEVLFCYPGLHAMWAHHFTHWLWLHGFRFVARFGSQVARLFTGIEIHPGAEIGRRLFIDHGMAVVVGETTIIGDDVTIYQGVTLGGTGKEKGKRHPTIGNHVVIGTGAKVLGPISVGDNARVGANAVVLDNVPDNTTMVGIPARPVDRAPARDRKAPVFDPYGIPCDDSLDPLLRDLDQMHCELAELEGRVARLAEEQMRQRQAAAE